MRKNLSISVFFPCYNDAGSIGLLIKDAQETLEKVAKDWEIIVIDDGSTDESRKLLKRLASEIPRLKLVFHKENRGYGGALRSGFGSASKKWVFYTDGDGQYDVGEITKLISQLKDHVDIVQGYKLKRHDPWYRQIVGPLYNQFVRLVFGIKTKDIDCDFRLIRKKALDAITLHHNSGVICVELVKKLQIKGFSFVEVGVHHFERLHGRSHFFNFRRVSKTLIDLSKLWWSLVILKRYD